MKATQHCLNLLGIVILMHKKIATKIFIDGNMYYLDDLVFCASIPEQFFTIDADLTELDDWLQENTEDIWWICFHDHTVRFKSESDATYMKLVLG